MIVKSSQVELLSHLLEAASLRHAAIAHNIANVNTPNYRRLEVNFEAEVERALEMHEPVSSCHAKVVESADMPSRADGNSVDIDLEIGQLNKNSLLMTAATQILALQIAQLRSAITGR